MQFKIFAMCMCTAERVNTNDVVHHIKANEKKIAFYYYLWLNIVII